MDEDLETKRYRTSGAGPWVTWRMKKSDGWESWNLEIQDAIRQIRIVKLCFSLSPLRALWSHCLPSPIPTHFLIFDQQLRKLALLIQPHYWPCTSVSSGSISVPTRRVRWTINILFNDGPTTAFGSRQNRMIIIRQGPNRKITMIDDLSTSKRLENQKTKWGSQNLLPRMWQ